VGGIVVLVIAGLVWYVSTEDLRRRAAESLNNICHNVFPDTTVKEPVTKSDAVKQAEQVVAPIIKSNPDQEPGPTWIPGPRFPTVVPTPTSTPQPKEYVADSNIFMDRVEGGPAQRQFIDDTILTDPNVTLDVPDAAVGEITPTASQLTRLHGIPGGAKIKQVRDGNMTGINIQALKSAPFQEADMRILQTAKELNLTLMTTNQKLQEQILNRSFPGRAAQWGTVSIIIPLRK